MKVLWFQDIRDDHLNLVGDKTLSLSRLYNSRFPVPNGFSITSEVFKEFLNHNNLKERISSIINNITEDNKNQAIALIVETIETCSVPAEIEREILEAYNNFNVNIELSKLIDKKTIGIIKAGRDYQFVAVRLSTNTGIKETAVLNVKGKDNLINAIKESWAYLIINSLNKFDQIDDFLISMVIQKMVSPERSGTIYSINPRNNNQQEVLIKAVYGIDTNLNVKSDSYIIDKNSSNIINIELNEQEFAFIKDDNLNSIVKKPISNKKGTKILNSEEIRFLLKTVLSLERNKNYPIALEFAIQNNKLFFLQLKKQELKEITKESNIDINELKDKINKIEDSLVEIKAALNKLEAGNT